MNFVILNRFPHYPGTERWDFDLVRYDESICHSTHKVNYVVDEEGIAA